MVVAEALSYGIPVITTTGTPWKTLEEFKCGWIVEPKIDALKKGTSFFVNRIPPAIA